MDKIKTVKIKNLDGSVSEETYTISVDARNVDMDNNKNLQETIGTINIETDGNITEQLENLNIDIKKKAYFFNTVADMKNANLKVGDYVCTLGYYEVNDGGAAEYEITNIINQTKYQEELNNGFYGNLIIKNNTINTLYFGIKSNGIDDDFLMLNKMINFINNYDNYLKVIFDGQDTMLFSDTLFINKSNLKIILNTDLKLTKTENISANNALKGIQIGNDNERLENIIIEGNNYYIDGNGSNVTRNDSTTSGLYQAKSLHVINVDNIFINNLICKNGYKDCCSILNCSNGEINNCTFDSSYRDNGLSVGSSETGNPLPIKINNCNAINCRDLGFSTWHGKNIIFNNCIAYNCGNNGETSYDNTYVSAGGGYSSEVSTSVVETQDPYLSTSFINCIAKNCKNYGFYFNTINTTIENCNVKNIIPTGTSTLRYGHGIICEDIVGNDIIKNCIIELENTSTAISCYGYTQTEDFTPYSNITINNCKFYGNVSNAIIHFSKIHDMKVLNCDLSNCSSSSYGIRFVAQSTTYQNNNMIVKNVIINNDINGNGCTNQYYDTITQNISSSETNKYGINVFRGVNVSFMNILTLNANELSYAIRAGSSSASQAFTNVYKGNILTNLANDVDSGTHS